jgi:F-box-like
MTILSLPTELLVEIFRRVPHFTDILACGGVCHVFRNVIETSNCLNYRIELERAGMIDNPYCKLSTTTRLEILRERERTWGHFDGKLIMRDLKVPSTVSSMYMVTPSAVVLGLEESGEEFEASGFQSIKLPCTEGEVWSAAWTAVNVGEQVLDFGTAIEEHDLLAYVT